MVELFKDVWHFKTKDLVKPKKNTESISFFNLDCLMQICSMKATHNEDNEIDVESFRDSVRKLIAYLHDHGIDPENVTAGPYIVSLSSYDGSVFKCVRRMIDNEKITFDYLHQETDKYGKVKTLHDGVIDESYVIETLSKVF